jgi:DNA mismatch endonuclease (patch repair protein)
MRSFKTDDATRRRMQRQRTRDTEPELRLRREVHARGLRYFVHRRPVAGLRREADLVFPRARLCVFVDGCFWHGCPAHGTLPATNRWYWVPKIRRNRARDADTDRLLRAAGWRPLRVWEHEDPARAAARVVAAMRRLLGCPGARGVGRGGARGARLPRADAHEEA